MSLTSTTKEAVDTGELASVPNKLASENSKYMLTPNYVNPILTTRTLPTLHFENLVTLQDAIDNSESFSSLKNVLS